MHSLIHSPSHHSGLRAGSLGHSSLASTLHPSVAPDSSHCRKVVFLEASITLVPELLPGESLLPAGQMELHTQDSKGAMGLGHRVPSPSKVPNSGTYSRQGV